MGRKITRRSLTWFCALVLVVVPLRVLEMEITLAYQRHVCYPRCITRDRAYLR